MTSDKSNEELIKDFKADVSAGYKKFLVAVAAKDIEAALRQYSNMVSAAATAQVVIDYTSNKDLQSINTILVGNLRGKFKDQFMEMFKK